MQSRVPKEPLVEPGRLEHHVRDMTATVAADLTLADTNRRLAESSQWLPLDGDPALSLGTLLLRNSTGPLRLGFGGWRDLLLGVQFLDGQGRLVSVGGRVVKNVAGYDVTKFLVGSFGSFGTPVTLTTRTYRLPAGALSVETTPGRCAVNTLLVSPLKPHAFHRTLGGDRLAYFGDEAALAYYRRELRSLGGVLRERTVDDDARDRAELWRRATAPGSFRVVVPPARVHEFLGSVSHDDWCADPAFGVIVGRCDDPDATEREAGRLDGSCACFDADNRPLPIRLGREVVAVLRELKRRFDPAGVLPALPVEAL